MTVAVLGFGSSWSRRRRPPAVYFNTTGVTVNDVVRTRALVYGIVRFDGASGFDPHRPERFLGLSYESTDVALSKRGNRVALLRTGNRHLCPGAYLVSVRSESEGLIDLSSAWKPSSVLTVSMSMAIGAQEALLLMPAFAWLRTERGLWILHPDESCPARADLRLT